MKNIRRGRSASEYVLILSALLLISCGGKQSHPPPSVSKTGVETTPLDDLLGQATEALEAAQDSDPAAEAVVRFLIFTQGALPREASSQEALATTHFEVLSQAMKKSGLPSLVASKLAERFSIAHLSPSDELPINLSALSVPRGNQPIDLAPYQGLTFISYQGRALKEGKQLDVLCNIASELVQQPPLTTLVSEQKVVIGLLATYELIDLPTLQSYCASDDEKWVRPAIEQVASGLRFISRGLNQWGRPELELGPLSPSDARLLYPLFMSAIAQVQRGKMPKEGERLQDHLLGSCIRPSHHYETSCLRLISTSSQD